jgi:hypothetical protein
LERREIKDKGFERIAKIIKKITQQGVLPPCALLRLLAILLIIV